jgi:hypothetical protein
MCVGTEITGLLLDSEKGLDNRRYWTTPSYSNPSGLYREAQLEGLSAGGTIRLWRYPLYWRYLVQVLETI